MNKLLHLLQDGRFHSGRELGNALGVSRGSVWKYLRDIEEEFDVELHRVRGRGYRLKNPLSLFSRELLEPGLRLLNWHLHLYDSLDSTNAEALRLLQAQTAIPLVVLAEAQTAGRGRRGRTWVSPAAQNLYLSLAYHITGGMQQLSGLSLVAGLAVKDALHRIGITGVGLKWPNDVYVGGKKIAGVLLELTGDPADICHVVIGVGINVNMLFSDDDIDQPWTSLRAQQGSLIDRNKLVLQLGESLHSHLQRHAELGFAEMRLEWEACHIWQGRECVLSTASRQVNGVVLGVDDQGALRLLVDGHEQVFSGGELSLRLAT